MTPARGEIWWAETEHHRRPVLVVTRTAAIGVLRRITVVPITRTMRHIPTEVALGPDQGLPVECVAPFDNLRPMDRSALTERIGHLTIEQSDEICRALAAMADCH